MAAVTPRVRPEFEMVAPFAPGEVVARVKGALARDGAEVIGLFAKGWIELVPLPAARHFWSPRLTADIEPIGESDDVATRVRVRFGPHPHVWTLYVGCLPDLPHPELRRSRIRSGYW